jgi:hypothetical protein
METQPITKYAHLYLGLTRQELARRLSLGQIDPQILRAQLDQNAEEIKLEALCEKWIESHQLEQVDKYEPTE